VFCTKNCFHNAKFLNLVASGGGGENFLTKPRKGTSLADVTHCEPLIMQIRSQVYAPGVCTKKGTLQKVTDTGHQ